MFKFEIIKGVSYHNNIKKNIQINFPSNKYFWPYQNSFATVKENLFQEKSSSVLEQSMNSIKFINWDWQYHSRGRSNFQEKSHSRFTRSIYTDWPSDKQEIKRPKETQFSWEENNTP